MKPYALAIFMKAPRLGEVKTRMQPELSQQESLALYQAMAEDLTEHFRFSPLMDVFIFIWPPDAREAMQNWLGSDFRFLSQPDGNLGEKMSGAFRSLFESGYQKAVVIGSDLPCLQHAHLEQALLRLDRHDAVLGPTEDGGYYLIALNQNRPELFHNIPWSTEDVLEKTLENARIHEIDVHLLEQKMDIDTWEEARRLWEELRAETPRIDPGSVPRTYHFLKQLFLGHHESSGNETG